MTIPFLLLALLPLISAQLLSQDKRNVLVIIADDVGFETSVYNSSAIRMPNLARLGAQSVVMRNAFTSVSSCSPSRSVILTGMPQHQNGMYGLHNDVHHFMTFDKVKSLPLLLEPYGIHTGMIGKKHVGPSSVYKFDFERDSQTLDMLQCARNITQMKLYVRDFFAQNSTSPFMLYMGFNDAHRCGGEYGEFCEKFGNGEKGMGVIEDWEPEYYDPKDVTVPFFLPDTLATRIDITKQYTSLSRLDAGIGMLMSELERVGHLDDTLIIYVADNGIPFPNAKTNLFEWGMREPMLISNPLEKQRWGQVSDAMTSTMDIVPTVLDWFGIPMPGEKVKRSKQGVESGDDGGDEEKDIDFSHTKLTGHSMLPITGSEPSTGWDHVYASHNFHEVTMFYPMRVVRDHRYRLIHNLNNRAPYPVATDLFACATFQEILNNTAMVKPTGWFKTLDQYYFRDEWELYDLQTDPHELKNLAYDPAYADVRKRLTDRLHSWLMKTGDSWHCYPHGVLYGGSATGCGSLHNDPKGEGCQAKIIH